MDECVGDLTKAIVIDTETTGLDPAVDTIVEVAAVYVDLAARKVTEFRTALVNPGAVPINPVARGAHHITDEELIGAPPREVALDFVLEADTTDGNFLAVAHNAEFDAGFLPELRVPWLCTWKMAKRIWPTAPGFGNQSLRYWLGRHPEGLEGSGQHHRALYDALVTADLLIAALETGRSPGKLLADTKRPILQQRIPFGKYGPDKKRGKMEGDLWDNVPTSYLNYLLKDGIDDPDVAYTVKKQMIKRGLA